MGSRPSNPESFPNMEAKLALKWSLKKVHYVEVDCNQQDDILTSVYQCTVGS